MGAAVYGVNLLLAGKLYGFGNFLRPIQSVHGYTSCFLKINVLQYLILFLLTKLFVFIDIALLLSFITIISKNYASLFISVINVFGLEYVLYNTISADSNLGFFKYINIDAFLLVTPIYSSYYNIDFFGYPFNLIPAFVLFAVLLFCVFSALCVIYFCRQKQKTASRLPMIFSELNSLHWEKASICLVTSSTNSLCQTKRC